MSIVHDLSCPEKRVVGMKQVLRYSRLSMLNKVFIAKDADEVVINKIKTECKNHKITYDMLYTMHQIGSACQIEVGSACAGVLKSLS